LTSDPLLAVLGGTPRFAAPRHVGRPNIGDRATLFARLDRMLDDHWLSNGGPLVTEFEHRLQELTGARHAIAVVNATIGIEIVARAAGLTGEVLVPAFTFVATAHALRWVGLQPVFCDVDPSTLTIDPADAERRITPRTSAILGVHVWGRPCAVEEIDAMAGRHGLHVLYDAAHALGCSLDGRPVGRFGCAEIFSFHATKFVNAFEGGAITTDDDALAERCRLLRNFGFVDYDRTAGVGTNGKMHEASAAMGLTSLEAMDRLMAVNRAHAERYGQGLAGIPGVSFLAYTPLAASNAQYAVMRVDAGSAGLSRDEIQHVLEAEGVLARRYFHPGCHRLDPYRSELPDLVLPVTDKATSEVLSLPTGTAMSAEDVDAVVDIVRTAIAHAGRVREALATPSKR
jgi:dTDP-4-amino-4,6-dideoxygalactose transaminase